MNQINLPDDAQKACERHLRSAVRALKRALDVARQHDPEATLYAHCTGISVCRGGWDPDDVSITPEQVQHASASIECSFDVGDW